MRIASITLLVLWTGCDKPDPLFCEKNPGASGCTDAGTGGGDGDLDGDPLADARQCFGLDAYEVCLDPAPSAPVTLEGTLDTGGSMCLANQPTGWTTRGQPPSCFIVGTNVTVNNVEVSGPRPLVIVATGSIDVAGVLDVASHNGAPAKLGPGAPFLNCGSFPGAPTANVNGGGGGAGGSFMTAGRNGGYGNNQMGGNTGGTAIAAQTMNPVGLRAGCSGQAGGNGDGTTGGDGGGGGGAVYLVAGATLTIGANGIINASGAGARPGNNQSGGGGGGSGGMIVLRATTILASQGRLLANGGGGASGTNNGVGTAGNDPPATTPQTAAAAVTGPGTCCTGNSGYAGGNPAQLGGDAGSGLSGGGGGGGGGYIQSNTAIGGDVSPPEAIN